MTSNIARAASASFWPIAFQHGLDVRMRPSIFQVAVVPLAPQADADLDVRALRSWIAADEDGDPVLVVKDDHTTVVVDVGCGGSWDAAIRAAENLSATALSYGARLRSAAAQHRKQSEPSAEQP